VDIHDLRRSGRRATREAWLSNPLRKSFFLALRPYFAAIVRALASTQENVDRTLAVRQEDLDRMLAARQEDLDRTLRARQEDLDRLSSTTKSLSEDVTASVRTAAAVTEELKRIGVLIDGLRKDQLASAHRLGSLEDSGRHDADSLKKEIAEHLQRQLASMEQRVEAICAPAGMATLMPNQALAVSGTSLVFSSGPYGRFLLRQPDLVSGHILAGSFWDSHLKPVIERAGRSDGSAIDAGAYLGFHSAYMSRFFRNVHAFEPQVEIYRMLCANLLLNNCRNVTATNGALYDSPGRLRLADSNQQEIPLPMLDGGIDYDRIGNAAALSFQLTGENESNAVIAQTIDQIGLRDLAFIKVDTQGSDLHVLKGAQATIQRCRPVITAEYERELALHHGDTLEHYHRFFDEMEYDVQVLDDRNDGKQIDLLATPR
jgi:FkbM family methyltransferase